MPEISLSQLHWQSSADRLFFLGVDAGGSKTDALITDDDGNILGKGRSGCGNHQLGAEAAARNIEAAVHQALQSAGLTKEAIAFAFFGLAGADRQADYQILRPMIAKLGFSGWQIECDTMIALRAASRFPYGVVLICGTGSNCAARSVSGEEIQIGGFGELYGDFGGGQSLANDGFRAVIRAWDGREKPTKLTELFLTTLRYPDVETMRDDFLDHNYQNVPLTVVPPLLQLAVAGDAAAQATLYRQGKELAISAKTAICRSKLEQEDFDIVLAGSVVVKGPDTYLRDQITQEVATLAPFAKIVKLTAPPVIGAVFRAMDEAGVTVTPAIRQKLKDL